MEETAERKRHNRCSAAGVQAAYRRGRSADGRYFAQWRKATSVVVCGQVWNYPQMGTNYPRGRFDSRGLLGVKLPQRSLRLEVASTETVFLYSSKLRVVQENQSQVFRIFYVFVMVWSSQKNGLSALIGLETAGFNRVPLFIIQRIRRKK